MGEFITDNAVEQFTEADRDAFHGLCKPDPKLQ